MSDSYHWEVFYKATQGLACGSGRIQERLELVMGSYLCMRLNPSLNLRPDLEEKAQEILRRTTCKPASGDEGTVAATCRQLSDDEAVAIAEDIFSIFNEVCQMYGEENARVERRSK